MNINTDEILSQLYCQSLYQQAQLNVLREMILPMYADKKGLSIGGVAIVYDETVVSVYESLLSTSLLQSEYLDEQSEKFLQKIKDELKKD